MIADFFKGCLVSHAKHVEILGINCSVYRFGDHHTDAGSANKQDDTDDQRNNSRTVFLLTDLIIFPGQGAGQAKELICYFTDSDGLLGHTVIIFLTDRINGTDLCCTSCRDSSRNQYSKQCNGSSNDYGKPRQPWLQEDRAAASR